MRVKTALWFRMPIDSSLYIDFIKAQCGNMQYGGKRRQLAGSGQHMYLQILYFTKFLKLQVRFTCKQDIKFFLTKFGLFPLSFPPYKEQMVCLYRFKCLMTSQHLEYTQVKGNLDVSTRLIIASKTFTLALQDFISYNGCFLIIQHMSGKTVPGCLDLLSKVLFVFF